MHNVNMSHGNTSQGPIVLRKDGNNLDVFYGDNGWQPWARFKMKKTQRGVFLEHVDGDKVPSYVMHHLITTFNK